MNANLNGDTLGAIIFALAAGLFVWRFLSADLQRSGIRPVWRHLLIGGGLAAIAASLLHYLGVLV